MTENAIRYPQYVAALAATGGALAAGTVLGWTAPAKPRVSGENGEYDFVISDEAFSWIGAVMTLGAAFVCIPIGIVINRLGRKLTMLLLIAPFMVGWALMIWAQNVWMMIVGRFLLGMAGGAFCVTSPIYIGEIAQKEIRGSLGSYFQLMVTIGILFVYAVGYGVNVFVLCIICAIIPLVFGAVFAFMPESPTYLVAKDDANGAMKSIKWLRGDRYDASAEVADLQTQKAQSDASTVSTVDAFKRPAAIRACVVAGGLMFFQQMSGINAVIFYTTDIFEAANTGIEADVATIIVGVMQVVATLVSSLVVDRLGRRILLLLSDAVMAICTIMLGVYFYMKEQDAASVDGISWLPIVALSVFIVMFSLGFGPIPWVIAGEVFAPEVKGLATSLAGTFNWLLAFIVTKTFSNLNSLIGIGPTFWLFSALSIVGTVFVYLVVPETKGKSLPEIQAMLDKSGTVTQKSTESHRF